MTPQQSKIMEWLEFYGDKGMTVYQAVLNGCGTELRKHACVLKSYGYPITSQWFYTNGKHYKKYYLGQS